MLGVLNETLGTIFTERQVAMAVPSLELFIITQCAVSIALHFNFSSQHIGLSRHKKEHTNSLSKSLLKVLQGTWQLYQASLSDIYHQASLSDIRHLYQVSLLDIFDRQNEIRFGYPSFSRQC